ncbi:MAG: hypothetical protein IPG56_10425 [Caulobacteraceae bacterium]|nr:hypothetical protein [Caulobacteraceae bacterium]
MRRKIGDHRRMIAELGRHPILIGADPDGLDAAPQSRGGEDVVNVEALSLVHPPKECRRAFRAVVIAALFMPGATDVACAQVVEDRRELERRRLC